MAQMLGMDNLTPLRPSVSDPTLGLGRVGTWGPGTLGDLVDRCKAEFGEPPITFVGDPGQQFARIAICTGSGASLIPDAVSADVDAYVTGDLKYHDADIAGGMPLVCVPHGVVESATLAAWAPALAAAVPSTVTVTLASRGTDPWTTAD
jgi:putative NIF3 family GTP cyclohydrolase 1 type 2